MNKKISISVIIPTHNRCDLLRRAIDSVLKQTYVAHEIIIVDDVGDNNTKNIIDGYSNDSIIYTHNAKEGGASQSRNLGVKQASGDFVAFLDDDDEWLPNKLEKQYTQIIEKNLDACFSQLIIKYEGEYNICYSTKSAMRQDFQKQILIHNFIGGTISAVIRKSIFIAAGGFDVEFPAREEYDLWINISKLTKRIGIISEPLAIAYRSLDGRNRISANIDNYIKAIDILNIKHEEYVNNLLNSQEKELRTKAQYDFLAAQAVSIGLRKEAVKYYYKSAIFKPSLRSLLLLSISFISPILLIKIRAKM